MQLVSRAELCFPLADSELFSEESIDWKTIVPYILHVSNEEITLVVPLVSLYIEGERHVLGYGLGCFRKFCG